MKHQCIQCEIETDNPRFCSRSCAAVYNNKVTPKRKKKVTPCTVCGDALPHRTKRTKCITCRSIKTRTTLNCAYCQREYVYSSSQGHTKTFCNSCSVNKRRLQRRAELVQHFGGKCTRCGYSEFISSVCFHHTDPTEKEFNISGAHTRSWDALLKEAEKCVLLCANCHMAYHAGMW
jgi:hypothetical protein